MNPTADHIAEANLADLVRRHRLSHLEVRRHGASLALYTSVLDDRVSRARRTAISRTRWRLDMPLHTGRWQPTPHEGSVLAIFALLTGELAPLIARLE